MFSNHRMGAAAVGSESLGGFTLPVTRFLVSIRMNAAAVGSGSLGGIIRLKTRSSVTTGWVLLLLVAEV